MSLFDIPKPYLNQTLWTSSKELKSEVREYLISLLGKIFSFDKIYALTLIGSSAGYQYSDTSDIDINVMARKGEDFEVWHPIFKKFNEMPNLLPGTQHPINFFFQEYVPDTDWSNSLAAYDILMSRWIKNPIPFDKIRDLEDRFASEIQYGKMLLDMIASEVMLIEEAQKLQRHDEVRERLSTLTILFKTIEDNRKLSYKYRIGTPALQEYNVLYKLIEDSKYHELFKQLIATYDNDWKPVNE